MTQISKQSSKANQLVISHQLRESYHRINRYYHCVILSIYQEDLTRYVQTTSRSYHEKIGGYVHKS